MTEETLIGAGGIELFVRTFRPQEKVRGVVVIVHGFKSHGGMYTWTAARLLEHSFVVHTLDLRGHGRSGGERAYVEKFSDYVDDLHALVALARTRDPDVPVFLFGHSAGGVIACSYVLEHQEELSGLICESFAHEVPAPDFALALLKGVSRLAPHAHVLKLRDEDFSRDEKFVAAMKADPLIVHTPGPLQTGAELVREGERLKREFGKITLPVLILHGTGDKLTKPSGSQHFHAAVGSEDKLLRLYDGHYHDLLNDLGKEVVMAEIIEWLTMRARA